MKDRVITKRSLKTLLNHGIDSYFIAFEQMFLYIQFQMFSDLYLALQLPPKRLELSVHQEIHQIRCHY